MIDTIRDRVSSVCARVPFTFSRATTPFSFDLQPSGDIDQVFRIQADPGEILGGFNYTEERTDHLQIWVARKYNDAPEVMYDRLLTDASSLRAAVIRDGCDVSGEYMVPDDGGFSLERDPGKEFAVLRLSLAVNYETTV